MSENRMLGITIPWENLKVFITMNFCELEAPTKHLRWEE